LRTAGQLNTYNLPTGSRLRTAQPTFFFGGENLPKCEKKGGWSWRKPLIKILDFKKKKLPDFYFRKAQDAMPSM
jgi:hypothetical protein